MLIYELSDGERSTREIATLAGVKSNATVSNYWRKWYKLGIVEPSEEHEGRFKKICSLEEVGLTIPPLLGTVAEEQTKEEAADEREKP
ncbi:MAG: hypothetical protein QXL25_07795 [Candidatus Bathyarchaeia archaeon]